MANRALLEWGHNVFYVAVTEEQPKNEKSNGGTAVLQQLANSPNTTVQIGTLIAVMLTGIVNGLQNHHISDQNIEARDKAVRQINTLYNKIDEFEQRQMRVLTDNREITESNNTQLRNQGKMLENQQTFLKLLNEEREIDINRILTDVAAIKKKLGIEEPR